jgi:hypothetical protein
VWVGGDVLKVYRFFVPVVPVLYFLFVVSLVEIISLIGVNRQRVYYNVVVLCAAVFSYATYSFSYEYIWANRNAERTFIGAMHFTSAMLKKHMGPDFSIAASTIGIAGYQLLGHRVIDMLGLTDSYIARNPERVERMVSSWKERRFNNTYLLEQHPDFILFSTGYKPSSPAERAIMLHSEFRHNYSTTGFMRKQDLSVVWRRKGVIDMSKDVVHPDIEFVNELNDGLSYLKQAAFTEALADFREARRRLGGDYAMLSSVMGECFLSMNTKDSGLIYLRQALVLDTLCWEARMHLIDIASNARDTATVIDYINRLKHQSPWIFDKNFNVVGDFRADESFLN